MTPCPFGGIAESEPVCFDGYVDEFNGGCDAATPGFSAISSGDPVCGQGGVFLTGSVFADTDWYEIIVTEPTDVQTGHPCKPWAMADGSLIRKP